MKSRKCLIGKLVCAVYAASALGMVASLPVLAGTWKSDATGWWYRHDDGSYTVNGWEWIDASGEGTEKCYYFDENGYMLTGKYTTTPDGYQVNPDGAWVVDGDVQTRPVADVSGQGGSVAVDSAETKKELRGFYVESTGQGVIASGSHGEEKIYAVWIDNDLDMSYRCYDKSNTIGFGLNYRMVEESGNTYTFRNIFQGNYRYKIKIEKTGDTIRVLESDDCPELVGASFVWMASSYRDIDTLLENGFDESSFEW